MVTLDDIRGVAMVLPRSTEGIVRNSVRFRVGQIVYAAVSADETVMGFGFPKEERAALVGGDPGRFSLPRQSDLRFNWVHVRMAAIDEIEMAELVVDAWRMVVPKKVAASYDDRYLNPD